ncbi:MAG: hypothetical protein IPJ74_00725 [Saprospiraceae bacterium]|nr:hypothetical protein [Saprospiraceae bacterium]
MKKLILIITLGTAALLNACQQKSSNTSEQSADAPAQSIADGTHCFEYRVGQDVTSVQLVLNGSNVSGEMNWTPFEKDGGYGTLKGMRMGDEIVAVWSYTIEGSSQSEEVHFKIEGDQLMRKVGELEDPNFDGNLKLKDPATATYSETYTKVDCQ